MPGAVGVLYAGAPSGGNAHSNRDAPTSSFSFEGRVLRAEGISQAVDTTFDSDRSERQRLFYESVLKRLVDVLLATVGLIAALPIWLAITLAVKLDSPGPSIFVQERVGQHGRRFRFYKFRTMYIDADRRLAEVWLQNEVEGPVFKMRNDPRVSRVGSFLRRSSLDE